MDYTQWADEVAYVMRDYYEANRPLRWWEKRNPPGSWGCIADDLMLGLLDIALRARHDRAALAPHGDAGGLREALPIFERVTRLADRLASDVPITAEARKHIGQAYEALAALEKVSRT